MANDSTMMRDPKLLQLPVELRLQIYTYLMPHEPVVYPLPGVGLTSVSCRPPSLALLLIHRQITSEVLTEFFDAACWKLVFSHDFNFFRIDPTLSNLEASACLRHMRDIEIVYFCDILLLQDYPSFSLKQFCAEVRKKADRACTVLRRAEHLRSVTVSWNDTTQTNAWAEKSQLLEPLQILSASHHNSCVTFHVGDVYGPENINTEMFAASLRKAIGDGPRIVSHAHQENTSPSSVRMLAFDVGRNVIDHHDSSPLRRRSVSLAEVHTCHD